MGNPKAKDKESKAVLLLALTIFFALLVKDRPALSQKSQLTPIFENVSISPDSSEKKTIVRGLSGGPVSATEQAGRETTTTGPCVGFVDREPDHTLELTGFFQSLTLEVKSSENTTLVVRGPGGSWCNDDFDGKNPGITGQWLSGIYEIWVGSYQRNKYYPYAIEITQEP
ncbi:MAG: hypothetical protein F6K35_43135 [Okeania sp. SIO2H7]|nr:hypothetical protein [Okeania sp. SIO2H7]